MRGDFLSVNRLHEEAKEEEVEKEEEGGRSNNVSIHVSHMFPQVNEHVSEKKRSKWQ